MNRRHVCLLLSVGLLTGCGSAQPQLPDPVPKFAVEFPSSDGFPPTYVTINDRGEVSSLLQCENRPECAIELKYAISGDLLVITAAIYSGVTDLANANPDVLAKLPGQKVGEYSGRMGDSVTLSDMRKFGLEPVTLKIVSPEPDSSAPRPKTVSKVPSIQIDLASQDRDSYTVAMHNLSTMAVTEFAFEGSAMRGAKQDLIAPGATYRYRIPIPHSETKINGVWVEDSLPPFIVLEAAFFKDGSYEGDPEYASFIAGMRIGQEVQRQRINELVEQVLADSQSTDDLKEAAIRSEVNQLSEEPDSQMIERIRSQFPGLPSTRRAEHGLGAGLNNAKQLLTLDLKDFEESRGGFFGRSLAKWWSDWRRQQN